MRVRNRTDEECVVCKRVCIVVCAYVVCVSLCVCVFVGVCVCVYLLYFVTIIFGIYCLKPMQNKKSILSSNLFPGECINIR